MLLKKISYPEVITVKILENIFSKQLDMQIYIILNKCQFS